MSDDKKVYISTIKSIKTVNLPLTETGDDVIVLQVNCTGRVTSKTVVSIFKKYPDVETTYKKYCLRNEYDSEILLGKILYNPTEDGRTIILYFGQERESGYFLQTRYLILLKVFVELNTWCKHNRVTKISIPQSIGCNTGGGDWVKVRRIIQTSLTDVNKITYFTK